MKKSIYKRLDDDCREANSRKINRIIHSLCETTTSKKDPAMKILLRTRKYLSLHLPDILTNFIIEEMLLGCCLEKFYKSASTFNKYLFRYTNWNMKENSMEPLDRFLALEYNNLHTQVVVIQSKIAGDIESYDQGSVSEILHSDVLLQCRNNYLKFTEVENLEIWNAAKCWQRSANIKEQENFEKLITRTMINLKEVKIWYTFYTVALDTLEELSLYNLFINRPRTFFGWEKMKNLKRLTLVNVYDLDYEHLEGLNKLKNLNYLAIHCCQRIRHIERIKSPSIKVFHFAKKSSVVNGWTHNDCFLKTEVFVNLPELKILKAQGFRSGEWTQDLDRNYDDTFSNSYRFMDNQQYALHVSTAADGRDHSTDLIIYSRTEALHRQIQHKSNNEPFRVVFVDPRYKLHSNWLEYKGLGRRSYFVGSYLDRLDTCLLHQQQLISKKRKRFPLNRHSKKFLSL